MTADLSRFGHHPDPAIDFEIEVGDIDAEAYNLGIGFGNVNREALRDRLERALEFRVGGVETCVRAKSRLRDICDELEAPNDR